MTTKGDPIPVRFDKPDEAELKALSASSRLSVPHLIRSAIKYAVPRFADGRVNIMTLEENTKVAKVAKAGEGK